VNLHSWKLQHSMYIVDEYTDISKCKYVCFISQHVDIYNITKEERLSFVQTFSIVKYILITYSSVQLVEIHNLITCLDLLYSIVYKVKFIDEMLACVMTNNIWLPTLNPTK
jgi:hypothetical protein